MLEIPGLCLNRQLPALASINDNSALPNELVNVIRSIVPPPPEEMSCSIAKMPERLSDSSYLFKRRPTEKNLLLKGNNCSTFSAKDTEMYLEDIFIQLVEPNKYTDGNKILHMVLELMRKWKLDIAVQEQALKCLVCLSQQCGDLQPPPPTITSVIEAMECFHRFERIQRLGVKILKSKTFMDRTKNKVQVANLIFNSLCNLPGMDDFVLHAKEIVQELDTFERDQIRTCNQYVKMLLDFPNRKNDKTTVFLSWCALDTLMLLADSDESWKVFLSINGEDKLWRMSCRPELEERCQALLKRLFPLDNQHLLDKKHVIPFKIKNLEPVGMVQQPPVKDKELSIREDAGNVFRDQPLTCVKVKTDEFNQLQDSTSSDQIHERTAIKLLTAGELIRPKPLTPPPTIPDIDDRPSDEEIMSSGSPFSPFYTISSPSYSPPPETYASLERRFGAPLSPPLIMDGKNDETSSNINNREKRMLLSTNEDVSIKSTSTHGNKSKSHQKLIVKAVQCLFCNEPKAKRPLLMNQYDQISHCLLEPRNNMLYKLFQSNLCELHKMR